MSVVKIINHVAAAVAAEEELMPKTETRVSLQSSRAFMCQVVKRVEVGPLAQLYSLGLDPNHFRALVKVTWAPPSDYHKVGDYVIVDLKEDARD